MGKILTYDLYGPLGPSPLGSVFISDNSVEYCNLIGATDFFTRSLGYRRLGKFDIAVEYARRAIYEKSQEIDLHKLNLMICLLEDNRVVEAKYLLSSLSIDFLDDRARRSFDYYVFKYGLSENKRNFEDVFIDNPLLASLAYQDGASLFKIDEELYSKLSSEVHFLVLVKCFPSLAKCFRKDEIIVACCRHKDYIVTDVDAMNCLLQIIGIEALIDTLSSDGLIKLTPELVYFLGINHVISSRLLESSLFKTIKGSEFEIDLYNEAAALSSHVVSYPWGIKDKNTSDYGSRFYSLDLSNVDCFRKLTSLAKGAFANYFSLLAKMLVEEFPTIEIPIFEDGDVWYDFSYTYGPSKINKHIHTSGCDYSYLGTMVLYAVVPKLNDSDGILVAEFFDKNVSFTPSAGDLVFFPSWVPHGTSKMDRDELRITFNFDLKFPTIHVNKNDIDIRKFS